MRNSGTHADCLRQRVPKIDFWSICDHFSTCPKQSKGAPTVSHRPITNDCHASLDPDNALTENFAKMPNAVALSVPKIETMLLKIETYDKIQPNVVFFNL